MTLAISSDERALADVVRSFVRAVEPLAAARVLLDAEAEELPGFWAELVELGWTGLAIPTEYGGSGAGLFELATVVEALAETAAPGPYLSTVVAGAVISELGDDELRQRLLPGLADGSVIGAFGLGGSLRVQASESVSGDGGEVLCAGLADILVLTAGDDLVVVEASGARITASKGLDPTRRLAHVELDGVTPLAIFRHGAGEARRIGRVLAAAEASGGASVTVSEAVAYADIRVQFGRKIGSFQAVKHRCANMQVRADIATAIAWDAARPATSPAEAELTASVAGVALDGYVKNAEDLIQVLGGIGFTWEHDAHVHLRRAVTLQQVFGPSSQMLDDTARLIAAGVRRAPVLDLPPEAEQVRAEVRAWLADHGEETGQQLRDSLVDSGYLVPNWPRPLGRAASPVEQLVIDEELAGLEIPNIGLAAWVALAVAQYATPEQRERWLWDTLRGKARWCQLFSEPGAGSDAAAIMARGVRTDGGWIVSGQKVWITEGHEADYGLATIRTSQEGAKQAGITAMVINMAAPSVDIRPLREMTGEALFNEVFLNDVFVPDEDVVGDVGNGWAVAQATFGNERVMLSSAESISSAFGLLALADEHGADDPADRRAIAGLIAECQALLALGVRHAALAVEGRLPRSGGAVLKVASSELEQRVTSTALDLVGLAGIAGSSPDVIREFLYAKCLTIGGGTSEILRNIIAERGLRMPREL